MSQTNLKEVMNSVVDEIVEWQNITNTTPKSWKEIQQAIKRLGTNPSSKVVNVKNNSVWYDVADGFEYHIDVPGFTKEELSIVYEDKIRSVIISGSKSTLIGDYNLSRNVNQTLRLPDEAHTDISATLENGVLVLFVAKQPNLRKVITIA